MPKNVFILVLEEKKETITIPKNNYQNFVAAANQIQWDDILSLVDCEKDSKIFLKTLERTIKEFPQKKSGTNNAKILYPG